MLSFQVVAWGHEDSGGDSRVVGDRLQEVWKAKPQKSSEKGNLTLDYWAWGSVSLRENVGVETLVRDVCPVCKGFEDFGLKAEHFQRLLAESVI